MCCVEVLKNILLSDIYYNEINPEIILAYIDVVHLHGHLMSIKCKLTVCSNIYSILKIKLDIWVILKIMYKTTAIFKN